MSLLPSLRQKKRYIVFEVVAEEALPVSDIHAQIQPVLGEFLGQLGLARASPLLLPERSAHNRFILKVNHNYVDECKAALLLIKKIKNRQVLLRSITVSGTLKKAGLQIRGVKNESK